MRDLYIDIETYSETDIKSGGAYRYIEDPTFEILIVSYAFDDEDVVTVDLAQGETLPDEFVLAFRDKNVRKHAHNAVFERRAFEKIGLKTDISQWRCSAVKAAYCGLPLSLDGVSKALDLKDKKLETGKALIKYFSCPCKPTKVNGGRCRNRPSDSPEKWEQYKVYNRYDVLSEREIEKRLDEYAIPDIEQKLYVLDQQINDRGILIDLIMAENAIEIDEWYKSRLMRIMTEHTGLSNPNSAAQLKAWLEQQTGDTVNSLNKSEMPALLESSSGIVKEMLMLRQRISKTSVKKYTAMLSCACEDNRARGLFQFYGANRTGRWAGRLIQLQNLPQNHISDIELARQCVASGDGELLELYYDNVSDVLSQLIRTAFVAPKGKTFAVADFSAIEARVISWVSNEEWRLEVFRTHGKIYEATASRMFGIPIEMIKKGSEIRQKGKISELALGYGGSLGAMKRMGGDKMGLSDNDMMSSVRKWRAANPKIVEFWEDVQMAAFDAIRMRKTVVMEEYHNITISCNSDAMTIQLPSGRKLFYWGACIKNLPKKGESICYYGVNQETKQWVLLDTYGGKLTENIVQAIARDILGVAMLRLTEKGFPIVMHVHDENIAEVPVENAKAMLKIMCDTMAEEVPWAKGLSLRADGYITPFYKKD